MFQAWPNHTFNRTLRGVPSLGQNSSPNSIRRNAIVLFMCVELMLNAVNVSFVALSRVHGFSGQIMVFFVMTVAAAEAAVGLAIILAVFRHTQSVDLTRLNLLKG